MGRKKIQPTIYHNNSCSKSRSAMDILKEKGFEPIIIDYINNPLDKMQLISLIELLGIKPEDLIRKNDQPFKDYYTGKKLRQADYLNAMLQFPELMERPVIVYKNKAIIGRPPEKVLEIC